VTTYDEAFDLVCGVVKTAWDAAAVTADLPLEWDDVKGDTPGESPAGSGLSGAFGRVTIRTLSSPQDTQGMRRRYLTTAALVVQVLVPVGGGNALGRQISKVVVDALRAHQGQVGGVWFYDIAPIEVGRSGDHFQTNVTASVGYQEAT